VNAWNEFNWLKTGEMRGSYDHSNGSSSFIKGGKSLDQLSKFQLLREESVSFR
jgi:hypothetical protein